MSHNTQNQLNAAAASFSPSENRMMDDINATMHENEMDDLVASMNDNVIETSASASSSAALPSHLVKHAAEFWFPECRDCTCCNGYKFGCPTCCPTNEYCLACCGDQPPPSTQAKKKAPLCQFYKSPSGCRFGNNCRFAHE